MRKNLVAITNDLFDIASRVRSMNNNYKIFYNRGTTKYELHCQGCVPTLQLVLPYSQLDTRAIDYIAKTRVSNLDKIIEEITTNNEKVEKQISNQIIQNNISKYCDFL